MSTDTRLHLRREMSNYMGIVHVRIDYRLIHGQVATMWTNYLKATRIMVIDDEASKDEMKKIALKLATPSGVSLSVLSVEKAALNIKSGKYDNQKVMIILGSVETLKRVLDAGVEIKEVNIGNIQKMEGKTAVSPTVYISEEEARVLMNIRSRGTKIVLQLIPSKPAEDCISNIERVFGLRGS